MDKPVAANTLDVVKIAHLINALAIAVSFAMFWVHLWGLEQRLLMWADVLSALFALFIRFLHRAGGNDRLFLLLVTLMVFATVFFTYVVMTRDSDADSLAFGLWLLFFPFVAFLLLGVRQGALIVGLFVAAILAYTFAGVGRFTDWPGFFSLLTALVVFSMMAFWVERSRSESIAQMQRMLREKEMLLWEVNHRIKNNLNLIGSLLGLQAKSHPQAATAFSDARGRIDSIAAVHHMLYRQSGAEPIDPERYLRRLAQNALQACGADPGRIALEIDAKGVILGPSEMMALGLMTNELLTNSLKHAFKDASGAIGIEIRQRGSRVDYAYRDNGPGFSEKTKKGLGLDLIKMMAEQLEGRLQADTRKGVRYTLSFDLPPAP
ncbi:MAG: sensor histidine kinase [Campylobacterales bacterium]